MDRQKQKKPWWRKNLSYTILGSIVLSFIIYQIAFADHSSKLNVEANKISIEGVKQDLFQDFIAVVGAVEPIQIVYLDATEGGRVEEIYKDEGTMVKEGDVIMRLSNDNLLLEISNNEAQVAIAVNDLKTMIVNLKNQSIDNQKQLVDLYYDLLRIERLYNSNIKLFKEELISREEFAVSKENYERQKRHLGLIRQKNQHDSVFMAERIYTAEESVRRMQSNLVLVRKRLDKLKVQSPVDGELAILKPEIGEVISYGMRIGTINDLDSYKVRVEIDEHYISRIKKDLLGDCDFSNELYPAIIKKVYPEVKDGRFAVDMEFTKNVPKEIRIGQTSRIRLELGESKQAILVPRGSFYQSTGGLWIYVVDESGKFATKRNIRIGRQNPMYYEVLEGLEPGEKVIVSGYDDYGDTEKLVLK